MAGQKWIFILTYIELENYVMQPIGGSGQLEENVQLEYTVGGSRQLYEINK